MDRSTPSILGFDVLRAGRGLGKTPGPVAVGGSSEGGPVSGQEYTGVSVGGLGAIGQYVVLGFWRKEV